MAGRETIQDKLEDPWRITCPEGHYQLEDKRGPTVYCEGCRHAYRYEELIDRKSGPNTNPR